MLGEIRRASHLLHPLRSQSGVRHSLPPLEPALRTPSPPSADCVEIACRAVHDGPASADYAHVYRMPPK